MTLDPSDLHARLDRMESRAAIAELVAHYCHGVDKYDAETFMSIWHEDAHFNMGPPIGASSGHQDIRQTLENVIWPGWRETHHWTVNLVVRFDGPDRAHGVCDTSCVGIMADGITQLIAASYTDTFERRDGEWRIAKRSVALPFAGVLPDTSNLMATPAGVD
jgi:gamma-hexachlorocyclohexane dehydrochlorinase